MITQHRDGDVAIIEIDRHERRNALDTAHCPRPCARPVTGVQAVRVIGSSPAPASFCRRR